MMEDPRTIVGLQGACCFCMNKRESLVDLDEEFAFEMSSYAYRYAAETCYCFRVVMDSSPRICRRCAERLEDGWAFFAQIRSVQAELGQVISEASNEIKAEEIEVEVDANHANFQVNSSENYSDDSNEPLSEKLSHVPGKTDRSDRENATNAVHKLNCDRCPQVFESDISLEHHLMTHNDAQSKCRVCDRDFVNLSCLRRHWKKDHHSKTLYLCNSCPETFFISVDAMRHQENLHQDRTLPRFKAREIESKKMCDSCGQIVEDSQLFGHMQTEHRPKRICHICAKEFKSAHGLYCHMQSHTDMKLVCDVCNKVYKNAQILRVHKMKHDNPDHRPYFCPICPDAPRFKTGQRRRKHFVEVHNEAKRTFKCELCPKEFSDSGGRSVHMRGFHLKRHNYSCGECEFRALRKYQLDRHMVTHTGARDFECHLCGKTFGWKRNLIQHMKVHAKNK